LAGLAVGYLGGQAIATGDRDAEDVKIGERLRGPATPVGVGGGRGSESAQLHVDARAEPHAPEEASNSYLQSEVVLGHSSALPIAASKTL